MYEIDFTYNNLALSDFGYIICDFDASNGAEIVSGADINFEKVAMNNGQKHSLIGTKYTDCLTTKFDICKDPDSDINDSNSDGIVDYQEREITDDDFRKIARWLNRSGFYKFNFGTQQVYYDASFNIEKIKINSKTYGIRLNMETNSPWGYAAEQSQTYQFTSSNSYTQNITVYSDSEQLIYPKIEITYKGTTGGNLQIENQATLSKTILRNLTTNEVITLSGDTQIISTSKSTHEISDDFNYDFFTLQLINGTSSVINSGQCTNTVVTSAKCDIKVYQKRPIKSII